MSESPATAADLSTPLRRRGARRDAARDGKRRQLPVARLAFAGIVVLVGAVSLRIMLVDTPDGGRPKAEVAINGRAGGNAVAGATTNQLEVLEVGPEIGLDEVDQAVSRAPAETVYESAAVVPDAYGVDPDLIEQSEFGPLPRISALGEKPFTAYARPSISAASAGGKPLIAIVVTGLGINVDGTLDAVASLPDNVSLAFAPYGRDLERTVGAARSEGHEVFLEVPLEPFDYPENDPGPDTLLTGQPPRDNINRLYRVMGKFAGYAGLINNMGARFTASGADFGPVMEELGARGLGFIDDGSSNRSVGPQLAKANRVPFAKASVMLDANPGRGPILGKLIELEEAARRDGSAIGLATALPITIDTLVEWSKDLEARGFQIVPASALMQN